MNCTLPIIDHIARGDDGQDLIEYALLVALIAVVVMVGVTAVGQTIQRVFWEVIQNGF